MPQTQQYAVLTKKVVLRAHPDKGDNPEHFKNVQDAYEEWQNCTAKKRGPRGLINAGRSAGGSAGASDRPIFFVTDDFDDYDCVGRSLYR